VVDELIKPLAVVFDNDGLLLDTEPCWTAAEEALFQAHGKMFDLAAKHALIGTSPRTSAPILERLLDKPGEGRALTEELYPMALTEIGGWLRLAPVRPISSHGCVRLACRSRSHPIRREVTCWPAFA